MQNMAAVPSESHLLEPAQRLSRSRLWQWQRAFFAGRGVEAWRQQIVPQFITTNTFMAGAYAQVVFGWLRDLATLPPPGLDLSQPIYVLELGSGSGRLAYHFLRDFWSFFPASTLGHLPVKYVMTDFSQTTLDFWEAHPALAPYVAAGRLDFALFDAECDQPAIRLVHSGATLSAAAPSNPLAVIANYFFDGLRTDVFRFESGAMYEARAMLTAAQPEPNLDDPALIGRVKLAYEYGLVEGDYYGDAAFDDLLRYYQANLADSVLEFPLAALECLRGLGRLSHDRLLLLSADRGYHRPADLEARPAHALAIHGSFSVLVNYHALGRYVLQQGGQFLATARAPAQLDVCAALVGRHPADYPETRQAYQQAVEHFGPDDFYTVKVGLEQNLAGLEPAHLLAYLRLSGWDSARFMECFPALAEKLNDAPPATRAEWYAAVAPIWGGYYHLGEKYDLAFALGLLLYGLDHPDEALDFFEHSLRLCGPDARTYGSMALCHVELHQWQAARDRLDQSLALDPQLPLALNLRPTVQAQLEGRPSAAVAP